MRLFLTSISFAAWAAVCIAAALAVLFGGKFGEAGLWLLTVAAGPAFVAAGACWAWTHRDGRRPSVVVYVLMALLVVVVAHFLAFGVVTAISVCKIHCDQSHIFRLLPLWAVALTRHGWITVPIAWLGTALFVWVMRTLPPSKERPSVPSPARSRS